MIEEKEIEVIKKLKENNLKMIKNLSHEGLSEVLTSFQVFLIGKGLYEEFFSWYSETVKLAQKLKDDNLH